MSQIYSGQAKMADSPLMRKSGFDLRQRLGRGDRTIDQIYPNKRSIGAENSKSIER